MVNTKSTDIDFVGLAELIRAWARELGFQQLGITDTDVSQSAEKLGIWLDKQYHGQMHYMARHAGLRAHPEQLHPGTLRVISVRLDYLPESHTRIEQRLDDNGIGFVSRYALGRDYHKMMRQRLQKLARRISDNVGEFGYRAFVDSAPVLEKPLAAKAGLGWIGKHTNLINRHAGSWFFLGELFTDLPLPVDRPVGNHCGECMRCIEVCPTQAITQPYVVDARRCISYLTIELRDAIPTDLRKMIGTRIYGCDDCQLYCPWNRFAQISAEQDFKPRHQLDQSTLVELVNWDEQKFLQNTEGSAIRRIGYECWLRNLAVALGNTDSSPVIIDALKALLKVPSDLVREHAYWALEQHAITG